MASNEGPLRLPPASWRRPGRTERAVSRQEVKEVRFSESTYFRVGLPRKILCEERALRPHCDVSEGTPAISSEQDLSLMACPDLSPPRVPCQPPSWGNNAPPFPDCTSYSKALEGTTQNSSSVNPNGINNSQWNFPV